MEELPEGQVRFLVHGPDNATDDMVSASVFANKLATLVRALKAADRARNGAVLHDYKIKKLQSSSPTAILVETMLPSPIVYGRVPSYLSETHSSGPPAKSGIEGFNDCVDAIVVGERDRALQYGNCAKQVGILAQGASKSFGYAEVWTRKDTPLRVDPFLSEQSRYVVQAKKANEAVKDGTWFKGVTNGSFDGTILEVDLRGSLPECKLVLAAGSQEIDCVCRADDIEQIRAALNHRVQIYGRAIYDGKSGLPRRIEVTSMETLKGAGNLQAWKGAFEPFEPSTWESDD
jgi:hypothetical protein